MRTPNEVYDNVDRLLATGRPREAMSLIETISEPHDRLRHAESLALTLFQLRLYSRSANVISDALQAGLDSPRLRDTAAQAMNELGLHPAAVQQASKGTGGVDILSMNAWNALYKGRPREAEALAERALDIDPRHSPSESIRIGARATQGVEGAFQALLDHWRLDRFHVAVEVIILVAERLGRLEEIQGIVKEARLEPKSGTQYYYWIVRYYLALKRPEQALATLAEAPADLRDDPRFSLFRGMALCSQRRFGEAIPHLECAIASEPGGVSEGRYLAWAVFRTGHPFKAFNVLRRNVNARLRLVLPN